ncbi:AraC family transcriptional regulator [Paenibacillus planticolens]|uniref:Helix-turn-helix domain-containing protein n=1 Tax=Paenibacillus planticolens TaxID=2654976 RepID=A0ABX1ZJD1_9BACL|nr:AraC family transcriptional regulator [Paenibacillus planticolens]NOU98754.1 helix-turn-helix domain-containing protein [Paenibacillus planticolens]
MIKVLNGTKETVSYDEHFGIRLYINHEIENYPVHWHTAAEIIMPLENIYTVIVNDVKFVLNPGDIIVIPPGELHEIYAPNTGERIILQFDYSLLYSLKGFDSTFHLLRPCCIIAADQNKTLGQTLRKPLIDLMNEYFSRSLLKEAAAYALLIQFFVLIGRNVIHGEHRVPRTKSQKYHKNIDTFLKVCNYMNEHCTEDIRVDELAELAGFSKFHFTRLFKQFIGISYYDYLNQNRIMYAEKLLIDPNMSVTEVAMRSGFGSLSTFNRAFKIYKKCTPTQYKLLHDSHPHRKETSQQNNFYKHEPTKANDK